MRGPNLAALAAEATWLQGLKARMAPSSIGGGAEAPPLPGLHCNGLFRHEALGPRALEGDEWDRLLMQLQG
jgi:hypothetical protein